MLIPAKPEDENERLRALHALGILDTPPEDRYDRVTRLAKRLFRVPVALVSLVDEERQWFKSCQGLDASQTPREVSFCGHAILGSDVFVVRNALRDARFCDNPLVTGEPNIRFYAGCPLTLPDGSRVGTLCIIDRRPRRFGTPEAEALRDLAHVIERELAAARLATIDELTGLANRRGFAASAGQILRLCQRDGRAACLLYFDIDMFKQINDRFGHAEGDRALAAFARLLKQAFRASDLVGRLGGDEFAVLAPSSGKGGVESALIRLEAFVDAYNAQAERVYELHYTVGEAARDAGANYDLAELVANADTSMYAKRAGRACTKPGSDASLAPALPAGRARNDAAYAGS
jgi:diguanylate cyclase (GGDEF)-like protein